MRWHLVGLQEWERSREASCPRSVTFQHTNNCRSLLLPSWLGPAHREYRCPSIDILTCSSKSTQYYTLTHYAVPLSAAGFDGKQSALVAACLAALLTLTSGEHLTLRVQAHADRSMCRLASHAFVKPLSELAAYHAGGGVIPRDTNSSTATEFIRSLAGIETPDLASLIKPEALDTCDFIQVVHMPNGPRRQGVIMKVATRQYVEYAWENYVWHLVTAIGYSLQHNYDLLIYNQLEELPAGRPPHFSKILGAQNALFEMHYNWVFWTDLDAWSSPGSSVSLAHLLQGPESLIMQGEQDLCAAMMLFKRTEATMDFLREYWDEGAKGCCAEHPFDQRGMLRVLGRRLAVESGNNRTMPADDILLWPKNIWPLPFRSNFVKFVEFDPEWPSVQMHSALGFWAGSIDRQRPALLYHHGHGRVHLLGELGIMQRLVLDLIGWEPTFSRAHSACPGCMPGSL